MMALCSGIGLGISVGVVTVTVAAPLRLPLSLPVPVPVPLRIICRSSFRSSRCAQSVSGSSSTFTASNDAPFTRQGGGRGDRLSPLLTSLPSRGPFNVPTPEQFCSIRCSSSSRLHASAPARRNYDNTRTEGGGGGDLEEGCGKTAISNSRRLILYSKPGCCLCDGLKEKLADGDTLTDIHLEVRDITTNADWWKSYQYEIPVLARVREDDTEVLLPRFSPRLNAHQVQKKISALMTSVD